jgi:toxin FitB
MLLDTNVISELTKHHPDPRVDGFFRRQPPQTLFTASVCEAEIHYGLAQLPPGRRRNELAGRLVAFLATAFAGRILAFDSAAAAHYGPIRASRSAAGKPIAALDAMIAATACAYGVAVATRNAGDFAGCGVRVVDPWSEDS